MTDTPLDRLHAPPFWERVHAALGALRPIRQQNTSSPDAIALEHTDENWTRDFQKIRYANNEPERCLAFDKTQLASTRPIGFMPPLGQIVEEHLAFSWEAASARQVSLCLMIIGIDHFLEYITTYGDAAADNCLHCVGQVIGDILPRTINFCLPLGPADYATTLIDLPLWEVRAMAEKISATVRDLGMTHKKSHAGRVTTSIGLAITSPRDRYNRNFFKAGTSAIGKARRRGLGGLQIIDLRPHTAHRRKAA